MHMANAVGTHVLGLHAASNPAALGTVFGPALVRRSLRRRRAQVPQQAGRRSWPGAPKLEYPGVMDLIEVDDVIERFEAAARDMRLL